MEHDVHEKKSITLSDTDFRSQIRQGDSYRFFIAENKWNQMKLLYHVMFLENWT